VLAVCHAGTWQVQGGCQAFAGRAVSDVSIILHLAALSVTALMVSMSSYQAGHPQTRISTLRGWYCPCLVGCNLSNQCLGLVPKSTCQGIQLTTAFCQEFCCAVLCYDKCYAVLCCAVLCCAVLCCAVRSVSGQPRSA